MEPESSANDVTLQALSAWRKATRRLDWKRELTRAEDADQAGDSGVHLEGPAAGVGPVRGQGRGVPGPAAACAAARPAEKVEIRKER